MAFISLVQFLSHFKDKKTGFESLSTLAKALQIALVLLRLESR